MFSLLPYLAPKLLCFPYIRLLVCHSTISPISRYFSLYFGMTCFVLFYPVSISFQSFFFRQHFLVYFLELYCYFYMYCFSPFVPCSSVFSLFYHFWLSSQISYLRFLSNFPSSFFHKLISLLHRLLLLLLLLFPCEIFTTALADVLSLESEWQEVSSSLQDSSRYSDPFNNALV